MELKLINQELQKDFTTANKVEIHDKNATTLVYNGKEYFYQKESDLIADGETLGNYLNTLNGAMYF